MLAKSAMRRGPPRGGRRPNRKWALFLDVDGTILDLAATPENVAVPFELLCSLARLAEVLEGALALVSGRPAADLDHLFAPLALALAGQHGAELRLSPASPVVSRGPSLRPATKAALRALSADFPGTFVEDKGATAALHYRNTPEIAAALARRLEALVESAEEPLVVLPGKAVFDLKPPGVDKGTAIAELMRATAFKKRVPVFLGDDRTDEDGFAAVRAVGGMALRVGAAESAAFVRPAEVRRWLAALPARIAEGKL